MASLPHISIGGSVATGTHGSGVGNGCLSTAVSALEFVSGRGNHVRLVRGNTGFDGAVVSMGTLGIVTHLELDTVPAFDIAQTVHTGLAWDQLLADPWAVMGAAYSVSVFTRWVRADVGRYGRRSKAALPPGLGGRCRRGSRST